MMNMRGNRSEVKTLQEARIGHPAVRRLLASPTFEAPHCKPMALGRSRSPSGLSWGGGRAASVKQTRRGL